MCKQGIIVMATSSGIAIDSKSLGFDDEEKEGKLLKNLWRTMSEKGLNWVTNPALNRQLLRSRTLKVVTGVFS